MAQIAPCLDVLRSQANTAWPGRSTASDGWIGNPEHQSRTSDHNPDANGWVDALDLTHDPAHGADMAKVVAQIIAHQDQRISYVIWDGHIWRSYKTRDSHPEPWTPEPYTGTNPHTAHAHFSVLDQHRHETHPWPITRTELTVAEADRIITALKEVEERLSQRIRDSEAREKAAFKKMLADAHTDAGVGASAQQILDALHARLES